MARPAGKCLQSIAVSDHASAQYDLIVIGGNPAGLSLAWAAQRAGVERVAVLSRGESVIGKDLVGRHRVEVHYQAEVRRIGRIDDERVFVETDHVTLQASAVVISQRVGITRAEPPFAIDPAVADRVHGVYGTIESDDSWATGDDDILVVGEGESAATAAISLAELGAGVVLALPNEGVKFLSRWARDELQWLESQRRLTVLWRSMPDEIGELGGLPMAYFPDRRTPDLQFDHVVVAYHPAEVADPMDALAIEIDEAAGDRLAFLVEASTTEPEPISRIGITAAVGNAWNRIQPHFFPDHDVRIEQVTTWVGGDEIAGLREKHYNATITAFDPHHSDLWVLRVKPDHGDASHQPGQYATLGLGHWEPRIDNIREQADEKKRTSLIRRSYSISNPIFDEDGYLFDRSESDELEFYIVLVRPEGDSIPSLTPRLALKTPGERIYLGAKVAGRYTLEKNTDPNATMLFLSTGTGEAPHNAMITELLRKGHQGPILNAVTVRYAQDLAYREKHEALAERFPNVHYLPLPTREPGVPKRYLQDALTDGTMEEMVGPLDPASTHVFLCGNPSMIGLPEWDGDEPTFPETTGIVELLMDRGFTPDRRGMPGNIHYEEYW